MMQRREFLVASAALTTTAAFGLDSLADDRFSAVVFSIEKFATHDGPGIRTVVFLKGCPLRCKWCHSPESWDKEIESYSDGTVIGKKMTVRETLAEVVKDRDFYSASGGGLTLSGGEPLFRSGFAAALLSRAKSSGIHTALETSGYASVADLERVAQYVDLWLFDIKGLDAARHREHVGVDNAAILANLRRLNERGARLVLRCPMIPGENDFDGNLVALAKLADELAHVEGIDVEPYIPYGIDKARKLGLRVYEASQPDADYGARIVTRLAKLTSKPVRLG